MTVPKSLLLAIAATLVATAHGQDMILLPGDQIDPGFKVNPLEHLPGRVPLPLPLSDRADMGSDEERHPSGIIVPSTFSIRTRDPSLSTVHNADTLPTDVRPLPLLTLPPAEHTGLPTNVQPMPLLTATPIAKPLARREDAEVESAEPSVVGTEVSGDAEAPLATGTPSAVDGSIASAAVGTPVPTAPIAGDAAQAETPQVPGIDIIQEQQRQQQEQIAQQQQEQAQWMDQLQAEQAEQAEQAQAQAQQGAAGNSPGTPEAQPLPMLSLQGPSAGEPTNMAGQNPEVTANAPVTTSAFLSAGGESDIGSGETATASAVAASVPSGQAEAEAYQTQLAEGAKESNARAQVQQQADVPVREANERRGPMIPAASKFLQGPGPVIPNSAMPSDFTDEVDGDSAAYDTRVHPVYKLSPGADTVASGDGKSAAQAESVNSDGSAKQVHEENSDGKAKAIATSKRADGLDRRDGTACDSGTCDQNNGAAQGNGQPACSSGNCGNGAAQGAYNPYYPYYRPNGWHNPSYPVGVHANGGYQNGQQLNRRASGTAQGTSQGSCSSGTCGQNNGAAQGNGQTACNSGNCGNGAGQGAYNPYYPYYRPNGWHNPSYPVGVHANGGYQNGQQLNRRASETAQGTRQGSCNSGACGQNNGAGQGNGQAACDSGNCGNGVSQGTYNPYYPYYRPNGWNNPSYPVGVHANGGYQNANNQQSNGGYASKVPYEKQPRADGELQRRQMGLGFPAPGQSWTDLPTAHRPHSYQPVDHDYKTGTGEDPKIVPL